MRHAAKWGRWIGEYAVATYLTWMALGGLGQWLQAMAIVTLFLWAGLLAVRVLARLLEAFSCAPDGDEGDDGGPEEHPPIIIRTKDEIYREAIRRTWSKSP